MDDVLLIFVTLKMIPIHAVCWHFYINTVKAVIVSAIYVKRFLSLK